MQELEEEMMAQCVDRLKEEEEVSKEIFKHSTK